ncbi:PREDICTED: LOW QUALITY PROTEIN: uncharacterized protein C6orf132 homolog [Bison bison bison]|uniref:LOW QUALITY PROTEIN: uncharacterized protein C6orf132 homolog n=1 Tax=Bison bison bison TaxID=43346 RepID=A0A6P3J516_BISBB|nr:PREDICTED: LOW QUALITY PROTEIN: uncharacterized protein C6orf132 homolog [Bison bison bison]
MGPPSFVPESLGLQPSDKDPMPYLGEVEVGACFGVLGYSGQDGIYYGDNRFDTVSESGTATLKARPRVRPLLTFLPLDAQENHGLAVPTPCVPDSFADKQATGTSTLVNGNLRLYSSVGDLRPGHYGQDLLIPPPPPGPAPAPPLGALQPPEFSPPPPPSTAAPPPPLLESPPPPPPSTAPALPPGMGALPPPPTVSSPSTPTPPDFIPPAPPQAVQAPPLPLLPALTPPAPGSPHTMGTRLFPAGGVTKWKSEVALNGRQPEAPRSSAPRSPAEPTEALPGPESHLTFPRSFKVPPPTPVRTSSISIPEAQGTPPENKESTKKGPIRPSLPPSFHIRSACQAYPDRAAELALPKEPGAVAPAGPRPGQPQVQSSEQAETPPPAPPLPPPAKEAPPSLLQKEAPPSPPEKEAPSSVPEESPCSRPKKAATSLILPPVDYLPQDAPTPSVWEIRKKLEAQLSSLAEKEARPSRGSLPPKPQPEGGRIFENRDDNSKFPKPVAKNLPPLSTTPLPNTPLQSKVIPGPATSPKATPEPATPPKATPGPATPPKAMPGPATPPKAMLGPATTPKAVPGPATTPKATSGPATPPKATPLPITSSQLIAEKNLVPAGQWKKPEHEELAVPSKPEVEGHSSETSKPPTQGALSSPAFPPKISPGREEVPCFYKPHCNQNSSSREVAVVMPTLSRGEAAGSGKPVEVKEPQELPPKPPVSSQAADELLRHPVTGEVVERGSPMALLLAAKQRAQKGRPRGAALGRSSLPGSLQGPSQPKAGSDTILYNEGQPNSFTVVPKVSKETEKVPQLTSPGQPKGLCQWELQPRRDPEDTESCSGPSWTKVKPQASAAWERPAPSSLLQGRLLPKSFSSPPSPSHKPEEDREEEFNFEVIPPPPEFSNDPKPPAAPLQYLGRRGSPPRNNFSDLGQPANAGPPRVFSHFGDPGPARGLERFSGVGGGRSSAGRGPPGGLHSRKVSLEGAPRGEAKYKLSAGGGGDYGCTQATGRSPHNNTQYGSSINTFTVRPGTRHPISYAYSGAHWKAPS